MGAGAPRGDPRSNANSRRLRIMQTSAKNRVNNSADGCAVTLGPGDPPRDPPFPCRAQPPAHRATNLNHAHAQTLGTIAKSPIYMDASLHVWSRPQHVSRSSKCSWRRLRSHPFYPATKRNWFQAKRILKALSGFWRFSAFRAKRLCWGKRCPAGVVGATRQLRGGISSSNAS